MELHIHDEDQRQPRAAVARGAPPIHGRASRYGDRRRPLIMDAGSAVARPGKLHCSGLRATPPGAWSLPCPLHAVESRPCRWEGSRLPATPLIPPLVRKWAAFSVPRLPLLRDADLHRVAEHLTSARLRDYSTNNRRRAFEDPAVGAGSWDPHRGGSGPWCMRRWWRHDRPPDAGQDEGPARR